MGMMITRFHAECKRRPEGEGKFSAKKRPGLGFASMMGIPYGITEEQFDISRTHCHDLGKEADSALESVCASGQATERAIVSNKAFRERLIVALTCYGMSAANIAAFCNVSPVISHDDKLIANHPLKRGVAPLRLRGVRVS